MNDKFEEWYDKSENYLNEKDKRQIERAWEACKREIINHIKKDGHRMVNSNTIIEEIEKNI